jgi:hypothetical protein
MVRNDNGNKRNGFSERRGITTAINDRKPIISFSLSLSLSLSLSSLFRFRSPAPTDRIALPLHIRETEARCYFDAVKLPDFSFDFFPSVDEITCICPRYLINHDNYNLPLSQLIETTR